MKKNLCIFIFLILLLTGCNKENIEGVENYNKNYYINKYMESLDSNLSIFPDHVTNATFSSNFEEGLFDSYGSIVLIVKYDIEEYRKELERLGKISITIKENCYTNSNEFINHIKYDATSYIYPAYVTIDGFANTYEYALLNEEDLEIIYIYVAYPNLNNASYNKYLKTNKNAYSKTNTLDFYSIYNHSFDGGKSFNEYSDCQKK